MALLDAGSRKTCTRRWLLLTRDVVQRRLQLLDVAPRQFEILSVRAVEFESAEAVHDADRKLPGVLVAGQRENLLDEFANAADLRVANAPETVALGKLADLQAIRILARINDHCAFIVPQVVGVF